MHSGEDSSDNETGPDMPAGVLRSRGGWQDKFNLEVEHQRERLQADADGGVLKGETNAHAAVDLSQFRNEEVGKGYKAKHVVRQRGASPSATGVVDMSGGKFSKKERRAESSKKRSRDDGEKEDNDGNNRQSGDLRLASYLKCKGMRNFMKEIDKILKQGG